MEASAGGQHSADRFCGRVGRARGSHRRRARSAVGIGVAHAVLRDKLAAHDLSSVHWTRTEVVPIDAHIEQVNFYTGAQVAFEAAVRSDGSVAQISDSVRTSVPYGSPVAYSVGLLIGMGALFVLMTAAVPFRRMRNLDVAMALSLVAPMVLFQHRYVNASAIVAVLPLGYLALRCGVMALGRSSPGRVDPALRVADARLEPT